VVNGVLFACYHLHEPWVIPQTVLVDTFAEAGLSRRYRSALIGIAVHSTQTVFFIIIGLTLVLKVRVNHGADGVKLKVEAEGSWVTGDAKVRGGLPVIGAAELVSGDNRVAAW
jgi:hypothetical protein